MDFAAPKIIENGNNVTVSYGNDSGLVAVFDTEAVPDETRSLEEGRPCFREIEVITIHIAGGDTRHRPVQYESTPYQQSDLERFPRQWAAFKNKEKQVSDGTPLEEWAPLTKSQVYELKAMNIFTVEGLANLPDVSLTWMGARDLQKKAKLYIESAKSDAPMLALQSENDKLRKEFEAYKQQIAGMLEEKKPNKKVAKDGDIS